VDSCEFSDNIAGWQNFEAWRESVRSSQSYLHNEPMMCAWLRLQPIRNEELKTGALQRSSIVSIAIAPSNEEYLQSPSTV
jgi:hypothetical protein